MKITKEKEKLNSRHEREEGGGRWSVCLLTKYVFILSKLLIVAGVKGHSHALLLHLFL